MLSTIGYEGASLSQFVATLKSTGVEIVIDVRDRAQSRRRGFSKGALSTELAAAGIDYDHFRALGDPKAGREAARAGNLGKFQRVFAEVLATTDAQGAIGDIVDLCEQMHVCLLCYERDPNTCHRKIITDNIAATQGIKATHLGVTHIESLELRRGRVLHSREGVAA